MIANILKRFKLKVLFLSILAFFATSAFAQNADVISALLEEDKATLGQVSYLCASQMGLIPDSATEDQAVEALKQAGILKDSNKLTASSPVRMTQLAYILCESWNIQDSLMYRIMPCKRYAFMQLKALGVMPQSTLGLKKATGRDVLNCITVCIQNYDGADSPADNTEEGDI